MKVISLNLWGGIAGTEKLLDFLDKNSDVDVFCFQEMWQGGEDWVRSRHHGMDLIKVDPELFNKINDLLIDHRGYFRPFFHDFYGLTIFAKEKLNIIDEGEFYVHKYQGYVSDEHGGKTARTIQYITINTSKELRTIINFHGLWNGQGKGDSDDRLNQSDNIIKFLEDLNHPFIVCGDFNLLPETKSIKKFEDFGLINLITEYNIKSTRSSHYKKPIKHADYVLCHQEINIEKFEVLQDEVSDHLPLFIDIE